MCLSGVEVCEKMRGWWLLQEGWGGWGFGKGERGVKVAREKGVEKKIPFPPFFFFWKMEKNWKVSACTVVLRCVAYVSR